MDGAAVATPNGSVGQPYASRPWTATRMRVLIADDEPLAIERLQQQLCCIPDADLVGVARNGREALHLIREREPDVALLDVEMPGHTGFGVLASLRSRDEAPEVIFVTASTQHALEAFTVNAVDYLLKPVAFDRLREALRRAKYRLDAKAADKRFEELHGIIVSLSTSQAGSNTTHDQEIWVKEQGGVTRIPAEHIDLIEAAGDYVIAHVGETTHLISESLNSLEHRLDPGALMRIHRSAIVNLARVRSIRRHGQRSIALVLDSGRQVRVGPSYVQAVLKTTNAKRWR